MLPKPLYEALPFVYLGAGVTTVHTLDTPLALIPAILFGAAAVLALASRIVYRWRQRNSFY